MIVTNELVYGLCGGEAKRGSVGPYLPWRWDLPQLFSNIQWIVFSGRVIQEPIQPRFKWGLHSWISSIAFHEIMKRETILFHSCLTNCILMVFSGIGRLVHEPQVTPIVLPFCHHGCDIPHIWRIIYHSIFKEWLNFSEMEPWCQKSESAFVCNISNLSMIWILLTGWLAFRITHRLHRTRSANEKGK